jgi:hypothetical protein
MVGHTLCGCCNMPRIMEGLKSMNSDSSSSDSSSSDSSSDKLKKMAMAKNNQQ